MGIKRLTMMLVALVPGVAYATGPGAITNGPRQPSFSSTSSNWSGYASTTGPFTSVSASWTQPAVTCGPKPTYASFWAGLDGDGSGTVEQTGSEADCRQAKPVYYAWYEMYPAYPVNFSNPVRPHDSFKATVTATRPTSFTLTLTDVTEGWTHAENLSSSAAERYSAEVIAEAPSSAGGVLPLADFGTVHFSSASANGKAIGSESPGEITMASGTTVEAQPSALTNGTNFSVAWKHS